MPQFQHWRGIYRSLGVQKKVSVSRGQETLACSVLKSLDLKKNNMLGVVIEAIILIAEI